MKDIDIHNDDKLKKMLSRSTIEQPSANFTDILMKRLQMENATSTEVKEVKPKQWLFIILLMFIVLVGVLIWVFTKYPFDYEGILSFDFKSVFSFDSLFIKDSFINLFSGLKHLGSLLGNARYAIYFGLIIIFLLTTDLLIRKRLFSKHQNQTTTK